MWQHRNCDNMKLLELKNAKIMLRLNWEGIEDPESFEAKRAWMQYQQACGAYLYYFTHGEEQTTHQH